MLFLMPSNSVKAVKAINLQLTKAIYLVGLCIFGHPANDVKAVMGTQST